MKKFAVSVFIDSYPNIKTIIVMANSDNVIINPDGREAGLPTPKMLDIIKEEIGWRPDTEDCYIDCVCIDNDEMPLPYKID